MDCNALEQLRLFDSHGRWHYRNQPAPPPAIDRPRAVAATSVDAHRQSRPATRRARILAAISAAGRAGLTNDEIVERLGIPIQSVCPLTNALGKAGQITRTRRTRPTRLGRQAVVWEAVS